MRADNAVDLAFGRDLLSVTHADGTLLHFTRQERALLLRLVNSPGRLLPRDLLIEMVSAEGAEPASERHVDFLINQLRRKLRDNARTPRFIRTQYGEGYVWVGDIAVPSEAPASLLTLGAVYGESLPGGGELIGKLTSAIAQRLEPSNETERAGSPLKSSFVLEASLHDSGQRLHAALVLRDGTTSAVLGTFRLALPTNDDAAAIATTADAIAQSIWSSAALPATAARTALGEPPPWVRLFEAALMMDGDQITWRSNAERLGAILADEPDNAVMEMLHGLNLYTQLLQSLFDPSGQTIDATRWQAIEDEMETIALKGLARFDDQPIMQIAAAKLLLFINRGYLHMARRIADDVLASSGAHASAFGLAGEATSLAGDTENAVELLERALELSKSGSAFHSYLLVIEATAIFAGGDRADFGRICRLIRDVDPQSYGTLQTFCALDGFEQSPLFAFVVARDAVRAKESVRFLWNISGRHFALRAHRRNVMRPMTAALVQRYGLDVLPDEVDLGTGLRAEFAKELAAAPTV